MDIDPKMIDQSEDIWRTIGSAICFHAGFFFDPEDEGDIFLRNVD
jgi:hypothetical protein